jgi:uncharacterized membrane protein
MNLEMLDDRLQQIESRLTKIENTIIKSPGTTTSIHSEPLKKPEIKRSSLSILDSANRLSDPQIANSQENTALSQITSESSFSGNWLGIISIICFIFAAGFIIKLSIESGWLTPAKQIVLAALLGISLIGVGFLLLKKDRDYASLLPAAGIIILYITTFATYRYYELITFPMAIAATSIVSALCIGIYRKIQVDIYAITAAIGSYLSPAFLGLNTTDTTFTLYYYILCSIAFAIISVWVKSRTLTVVAAYLAILMSTYVGLTLQQDKVLVLILALHFLIFSIGTYFYTKKTNQTLTSIEAWSFFPVLLLFYAVEYTFIYRIEPKLAPWLSLLFAAFLLMLYIFTYFRLKDRILSSQSMILAFITVVVFHSFYLEILPEDFRPWLFIIITLGFAFTPMRDYSKQNIRPFMIPIFALLVIFSIEYMDIALNTLSTDYTKWFMLCLASFFSVWIMLVRQNNFFKKNEGGFYLILSAAHFLAIVGLYQLTRDIGSLAVSSSWLIYAILVMTFAFLRQDQVMAKSALFVLAFAGGKALLYDVSSAPTIVRIVCLLITGIVLYGSGLLMRKIATWKN